MNPDSIAIIGLAGRFPGATDLTAFWRNLSGGVESVTSFTADALLARGVDRSSLDDPLYVRASAVLDGVDMFDADFFGITPREAEITDPQHRVFLECAWEALEDSGYDPETYDDQIGVYAGAGLSTYLINYLLRRPDVISSAGPLALQLGNNKDYVPLRVSYKLQLRGPSVNVNTACSSSLVAVHMACQSLLDHQCEIALAGGVGIQVPQDVGYLSAPNGILSPDGHCRAFDARAEGTIGGNGAGIVVLKRYAEAVADGDTIRAIILGSAVNNDGASKVGFTAPSVEGQARVISEALAVADVDPSTIGYVEAHGTGTPLGDPIEVEALNQAFRSSAVRTRSCALGSVKTNVGHLDEAAGVTGLIKTVLALQHAAIPPSLNFERSNPDIRFEHGPFYVPNRLVPWDSPKGPRRAGVSSFGIGGTNAHAVLQEAPSDTPAHPSRPWQLLLLSARSESALDTLSGNLARHIRSTPDVRLADVAHTLNVGRKDFPCRRMVLAADRADAADCLESRPAGRVRTGIAGGSGRPVVFLFPGQGSQHAGMSAGLYRNEPFFRDVVDRCAELLRPHLGLDLRSLLYPAEGETPAASLDRTDIAQPALFMVEYALARLLMNWGIQPRAMGGHSIGEYVAACLAGVFSLEDALALVAARGRLMSEMPSGGMLAVELAEQELVPLLAGGLAVAAVNAPSVCVVSGGISALQVLEEALSARNVACRRLHTSHAFHSQAMEPMLDAFVLHVRGIKLSAPAIPYVSNLTGRWITADDVTDPDYWGRHLRRTVRFSDGVRQLLQLDGSVFVEVGPGQGLLGLLRRHAEFNSQHTAIGSMRPAHDPRDATACVLEAVGRMWLAGACKKPKSFFAGEKRRRVPLPTYPFERKRFWVDPPRTANETAPTAPSHVGRSVVEDWFYLPAWKRRPAPGRTVQNDRGSSGWLVFLDTCGLGTALVERLRGRGARVVTVAAGPAFTSSGNGAYTLNPSDPADYDALLAHVRTAGGLPKDIVHLWSVGEHAGPAAERWDNAQSLGFDSLLFLVQAASRHGMTDGVSLDVVSSGMQSVVGSVVSCPEKATLLGPVRVVPKEYPELRCRSIDVTMPTSGTWDAESLFDLLTAEPLSSDTAPVIAIRDGEVWELEFAPRRLAVPAATPVRLRQGGPYLITGGLGSMGLAFARSLAREVRAKLVLVGRTGLPPESEWNGWASAAASKSDSEAVAKTRAAIAAIRDIRSQGGEVLVIQADVADEGEMGAALTKAQQRFGALHGVIHTAGVLGQGLIHGKSLDDARRVFSPKAIGALVLERVLQDLGIEPDFLILCSSAASVAPIAGQVDYCAANAFLDAYAASRVARRGTAVISVDWGFWQELGLITQARAPDAWKRQIEDDIHAKGRSGAGVQALRCILDQCPPPQVLVLPDGVAALDVDISIIPYAEEPRPQHPWFDAGLVDTAETKMHVSHLAANEWVLDEHRPFGKAVLPGTAFLELARAAFAAHAGGGPVQMSDVYFLVPLVLDDDETKEIRTILKKRGAGFEFVIVSRVRPHADEWQEHARGEVAALTRSPPARKDIRKIERECGQTDIRVADECSAAGNGLAPHDGLAKRFHHFTPHWRNAQRLQLGAQQGLATLELAPQFAGETATLLLHPALADVATGFMAIVDGFDSGLPFHYERISIWKPLGSRVHSHARRTQSAQHDERSYDVTVMDPQGDVLLDVTGFTLRRYRDAGADQPQATPAGEQQNFCVEIASPGSLASLGVRPDIRRKPGPGEVEIEVVAAGLNFIEVLYALGMLPEPAGGRVRFGLECAGRIAAVGDGVTGFHAGDDVFGYAPGAFSRFANVPAGLIAPKPEHLSFAEAATIPAAFMTAYYSLITIGRLRQGERVLIQAASGGVGLAAVSIAKWRGAEILATAGSAEKRDYLKSLGIRDVFDSRSLDFAPQVLEVTGGKGVDVVLNSLGGEFIAAGLSVLARYGRFLELGKRDIFGNTALALAPFAKYLSFTAIDVGPDLPDFKPVWREVVDGIRQRTFAPLPLQEFPIARLAEAFEHMAQGRHIGKVVVSVADSGAIALPPRRRGGRPLEDILGRETFHASAVKQDRQAENTKPGLAPVPIRIAPAHARPALSTSYRAPTRETERQVVDIWQELLGVAGIGVDDNFLELRGDSLLAAQVTSRLYAAFSVKLPLSSVFQHPTAAELAARIDQMRDSLRELATVPSPVLAEREVEHEL